MCKKQGGSVINFYFLFIYNSLRVNCLIVLLGMLFQPLFLSAAVSAVNMKWFPGHYIMNNLDVPETENLLIDFKSVVSMRGIQRSYYWSNLEPSKGVYDFSEIEADLAQVSKYGKKLSIMIGYK